MNISNNTGRITGAMSVNLYLTAPLFGLKVNFTLLAPLGLAMILLSLWLIVRGFSQQTSEPG
jgi:hypothetical protein